MASSNAGGFTPSYTAALDGANFQEEDVPQADHYCTWDYYHVRCANPKYCKYQYRFGDIHLGQSCRIRPEMKKKGPSASKEPAASNNPADVIARMKEGAKDIENAAKHVADAAKDLTHAANDAAAKVKDKVSAVAAAIEIGILRDTDGDGVPDTIDEDDDNDGVSDELDNDVDGDGVPDELDNDDDGDGVPDDLDPDLKDANGDGVPDTHEALAIRMGIFDMLKQAIADAKSKPNKGMEEKTGAAKEAAA